MKKLFLFALSAIIICGCSKNENENPAPSEENIFSVDETSLEFDARGGSKFIEIRSSHSWTLSGGDSWCEPSQTSGDGAKFGYTTVYFITRSNTTADNRSTTFTIKSGEQSIEITITQGFTSTVVTVSEAGTLQQILTEQNLLETTELKIKGILDETDFKFLKSVLTLNYLDISDVKLEELPEKAFEKSIISYIVLPRSLKIIGDRMFYTAKTTTVQMFDEVIAIGYGAFYNSEIRSNSHFHFSSKLQTIGKQAFYRCSGLRRLKFPASLETIEERAFASLDLYVGSYPSLDYIFFEKGSKLKTIGQEAFYRALTHSGIIYMQHCTQVEDIGSETFKEDIASEFYFGTKTPPKGGFPFAKGGYVNAWTVKIFVPKLYVSAYSKLWSRDYGVQGRYLALEDNMPEDK